ncbi:MAG: VWA domain-containing protein [Myxococcota bacterium]
MRRLLQRSVAWLTLLGVGGCDLELGAPHALWLLWGVGAVVALHVYAFRRRVRQVQRFATLAAARRLGWGLSRPRQVTKAALLTVAILALVLALAKPRYGFSWQEQRRRGVDIVLAIDVSDSMLAQDLGAGSSLTRLEQARRKVVDLLQRLQGDRVALVAFAGDATLACPLTLDYGMAQMFASELGPDSVSSKGTDLAAAIAVATRALASTPDNAKAIVLVTDGEDHSGEALAAAEQAHDAGVRLYAVGIGRPDGAPIPEPGGGFRRDDKGEMVITRLAESSLQTMALQSGGRYVRSVTADLDLETLYDQGIRADLAAQEQGTQRRRQWHERFQWLVAVALASLAVEMLLPERRRAARDMEATP